jgi:hypothetical protein
VPSTPDPAPEAEKRTPHDEGTTELRELLITAGLEVLDRDGLDLGAEALGYSRVFAHLEKVHGVMVARASVHERIWVSNDEFRRDVLAAAIKLLPTQMMGGHGQLVRDLIADLRDRGLEPAQRTTELSRWLAPVAFDFVAARPALGQVQVAKAIASPPSHSLRTDDLASSLRERGDSIVAELQSRAEQLITGLGLRPRRALVGEMATAHEVVAAGAINAFIGAFLDRNAGWDRMRQPIAARGVAADDPVPWTPLGVGMEATIGFLFEADDDQAPADVLVPSPPREPEPPTLDVGRPTGRRPRRKLRDLVVGAGVEVLLEQRLDLRPQSLSYASVFDHVERTRGVKIYRSQVHRRIWDNHDAYWLAVLDRAVRTRTELSPATVAKLAAQDRPEPDDPPEERHLAAMDLVRALTASELAADLASPPFLRLQAIKAALAVEGDAEPIAALRRVIGRTQQQRADRFRAALTDQVVSLGFEVRPERDISHRDALDLVTTLALTLSAGAVFDQAAGVEPAARTFPLCRPGRPDRIDRWPVTGIVTWAVFDFLFQPTESQDAGYR